ncbi:MAG: N-acetylglucosamine-6-phosphate deacetylase [Chitinophagaceae bacterium]
MYTASQIFTGDSWLNDHAVVVRDSIIEAIVPVSSLPADTIKKDFANSFIAPAFIDLQIYGAHGKLLSVYPDVGALAKLVDYCRKGGAAYCLPTVATNETEVLYKSIDAINEYWKNGGSGVLGLHVEGPWINPVKRGAHLEKFIHSPSIDEVEKLLDYGEGVIKIITLAPEVCSKEVIRLIRSHNIVVSAGHSNATYKEAMDAFENGISAVTHLYNAMSPLLHRAPGLVGAAMNGNTMTSIVPDGYHVDFAAIRIAKQVMKERLFVITDAVTETKEGPYQHYLAGDKYESAGILSGSALTLQKALYNLIHHVGIDKEEALRMCSLYPAKTVALDHELGRIQSGYRADMVVLSNDLQFVSLL